MEKQQRLIDADALISRALEEKRFVFTMYDLINNEYIVETVYKDLADFINEAPTIDAVPVVRCKDCDNWDTGWKPVDAEDDEQFCVCFARVTRSDEFCSRGERRCDNE